MELVWGPELEQEPVLVLGSVRGLAWEPVPEREQALESEKPEALPVEANHRHCRFHRHNRQAVPVLPLACHNCQT